MLKAALVTLVVAAALGQTPAVPWRDSDLLQPAELAARLRSGAPPPKIFYTGFGVLYRSKHIPGAQFTGPAGRQEGLQGLRSAVVKLPRSTEVVIYCGCCPADHCPNIRPAFVMLRELGFEKPKLLWLPTSFLKDWVEKGYPVASGPS
jgi:thiosulfate/3-mercaptopyruvate sulfurtransferase